MIKRFNEMFDDEEMRDKLEIPYLQGEFTLGNPNLKRFSKPSNMITKETELKKILYKFPVLETFHKKSKTINGSSVSAFYATSMKLALLENVNLLKRVIIRRHLNIHFIRRLM